MFCAPCFFQAMMREMRGMVYDLVAASAAQACSGMTGELPG